MADVLKNEQAVKDVLIAVRDAAQKRSWYGRDCASRKMALSLPHPLVFRLSLVLSFSALSLFLFLSMLSVPFWFKISVRCCACRVLRRLHLSADRCRLSCFLRVAFGYEGEDTTISVLKQGSGGIADTESLLQDNAVRHDEHSAFSSLLAVLPLFRVYLPSLLAVSLPCSLLSQYLFL